MQDNPNLSIVMIWCNVYGWYRQLWVSVLKPWADTGADMKSDMDFQCKTRITTPLLHVVMNYISNKFWNFMKILKFFKLKKKLKFFEILTFFENFEILWNFLKVLKFYENFDFFFKFYEIF